jgi:ketosteroid isomerase-like protein
MNTVGDVHVGGGHVPDNVAVVQSIHDALAAGDGGKVLAALDESVEWHVAENSPLAAVDGKPFTGTQAVVENVFARLPQLIDGFPINVQRLVGFG